MITMIMNNNLTASLAILILLKPRRTIVLGRLSVDPTLSARTRAISDSHGRTFVLAGLV